MEEQSPTQRMPSRIGGTRKSNKMISISSNITKMLLQQEKKAVDTSYNTKTAGPLDFLEEMTRNYSGSLPYVGGASGALTGGLVGLGVGPLVEYFREKKEKDYKKALLVGLGLGAGTGGVLGAGTGLAQKQMINSAIDAIRK